MPFSITKEKLERLAVVQEKLSGRIEERPLGEVRFLGAVDVAYRGDWACAAFVLWDLLLGEAVKSKRVAVEVGTPYIPTFFFLRETRPILLALRGEEFDVLMVEGHGKAHPRGYGLASHIGLLLSKPTIGVAKRPLGGTENFARVGKAYVSVGHLVTLEEAVRLVGMTLDSGYPAPLKLADRESRKCMKRESVR